MSRDELPRTAGAVHDYLRRHRDDLRGCVLAFSGGKDSVALAKLVRKIKPDVPLVYAGCPGCEWPEHEQFIGRFGAITLDSGHDWGFFARNDWAFLHSSAADAERWAKIHHRGLLRRWAKDQGKTLLWGNRTADGNTVPRLRYTPLGGPPLWMPLRNLPDSEIENLLVEADWSPVYRIASCRGTGYLTGRVRAPATPSRRYWDVWDSLGRGVEFARFDALYRRKFGPPAERE